MSLSSSSALIGAYCYLLISDCISLELRRGCGFLNLETQMELCETMISWPWLFWKGYLCRSYVHLSVTSKTVYLSIQILDTHTNSKKKGEHLAMPVRGT